MPRNYRLSCAIATLGLCLSFHTLEAAAPISSPEGTLSGFVEAKDTLVYPPRSVRAQKVEFDTPDKQMIHEPDTPFRQFFNEHSPDFKDGKLDYAKSTILTDTIAMLRNKRYIRDMVEEVVEKYKTNVFKATGSAKGAELEAEQERQAQLLIGMIALALERENYPDLRDEDIEDVLFKIDRIGEEPPSEPELTDKIDKQNRAIWKAVTSDADATAKKLMAWELRQAFRERRYFSKIIDRAISQRMDIFRSTSSPVEPMKAAQEILKTFIDQNLSTDQIASFAGVKSTLWESLITTLSTNKTLVKPASSNAQMGDVELKAFSDALLATLVSCLKTNQNVEAAVHTALASHRKNLKTETISATVFIANAKKALETDEKLNDLRKRLEGPTGATKSAKDELALKEKAATDALSTFNLSISNGIVKLPEFQRILNLIKTKAPPWPNAQLEATLLSPTGSNLIGTAYHAYSIAESAGASGTNLLYEKLLALKKHTNTLAEFDATLATDLVTASNLNGIAEAFPTDRSAEKARALAKGYSSFKKLEQPGVFGEDLTAYNEQIKSIISSIQATKAAEASELQRLRTLLMDKGTEVAGKINTSFTNMLAERNTALGQLSDASMTNVFEKVTTDKSNLAVAEAHQKAAEGAYQAAVAAFDKESTAFQTRFNELLAAEAENEKDPVLAATVKDSLALAADKLKKLLLDPRQGTVAQFPTLTTLADGILTANNIADTSAGEKEFVSTFTRMFNGFIELVPSKDPILVAVLKSPKLRFGSDAYRAMATEIIPKIFLAKIKELKGTMETAGVVDAINSALEAPEVTYLFGSGEANRKAADAFKAEFYNSFKHRLAEAIAAEREADYDYWWLTFYPKAIAVGENRFQGESVLQVNFNESIVPSEQYHRWLQDQYLATDSEKDLAKLEAAYDQKTRLATGVLGDFLIVLDASNLSGRYPELREVIQEAMAKLSGRSQEVKSHTKTVTSKEANYYAGINYLFEQARKREWNRLQALASGVKQTALNRFESVKLITNAIIVTNDITVIVPVSGGATSTLSALKPGINFVDNHELDARGNFSLVMKQIANVVFVKQYTSTNSSSTNAVSKATATKTQNSDSVTKSEASAQSANTYYEKDKTAIFHEAAFFQKAYVTNTAALLAADLVKNYFPEKNSLYRSQFSATTESIYKETLNELCNLLFHGNWSTPDQPSCCDSDNPNTKAGLEERIKNLTSEYPEQAEAMRQAVEIFSFVQANYRTDPIRNTLLFGLDNFKTNRTNQSYAKLQYNFAQQGKFFEQLEPKARVALAWQDFDERHIAFAVLAASLKGITLPEKVEVYANAFFNGSRRFTLDRTPYDEEALNRLISESNVVHRLNFERYVLPFEDVAQQFDMARYLLAKGVTHKGVAHLLYKYGEEFLYPNNWYLSYGIVDLINYLDPAKYGSIDYKQQAKDRTPASMLLRDFLRDASLQSTAEQRRMARYFFRDVEYVPDARPSHYLEYPALWSFEKELDEMQEQLRFITVSLYHSSYPAIPSLSRVKSDFLQNDIHLRNLIYFMVRDLYVDYARREILSEENKDSLKDLIGLGSDATEVYRSNKFSQNFKATEYVGRSEFDINRFNQLWSDAKTAEKSTNITHLKEIAVEIIESADLDRKEAAKLYQQALDKKFHHEDEKPNDIADEQQVKQAEDKARLAVQAASLSAKIADYARRIISLAAALDTKPATGATEIKLKTRRVLATLLLDRHPYLTDDSRKYFLDIVTTNRSIFDWVEKLAANQRIMDQFSDNLLTTLYKPYFDSLDRLNKIERQPIPFQYITQDDFERFQYRNKPLLQRGIQIVDMLPASRDDLVSVSVNEGGLVARIAAQAEGSAAYDLNMFQTALRNIEATSLGSQKGSSSLENLTPDEALKSISSLREGASLQKLQDLSSLKQAAGMSGYALGASAKGSIYARAQSAFAYARRREYLDAAITAAGRGDNFAKWVIRQSDLRSSQAGTDSRKLVASAHNGQPNGDQPFNLLVKIPRSATHMDWDGRSYIFFNSSYSATGRKSFWRNYGWLGVLGKVPLTIVNHNFWSELEKNTVSAVYPFTWNVQKHDSAEKLKKMATTPSILGAKIHLDDTDKIRYSEVSTLLDAEANFIQLARQAQVQDLNRVMGEIQSENGTLRTNVLNTLTNRIQEVQSTQDSRKAAAELEAKQEKLEQEMQRLQQELNKLKQPANPASN